MRQPNLQPGRLGSLLRVLVRPGLEVERGPIVISLRRVASRRVASRVLLAMRRCLRFGMLAAALLSATLSTRGGVDGAVADSSGGDSGQKGHTRKKVQCPKHRSSVAVHALTPQPATNLYLTAPRLHIRSQLYHPPRTQGPLQKASPSASALCVGVRRSGGRGTRSIPTTTISTINPPVPTTYLPCYDHVN